MARAVLGAQLRAELRSADALDCICAMLRVLWRIDAIAARVAKRIARRLTRFAPLILIAPPATPLLGQFAPTPASADSS